MTTYEMSGPFGDGAFKILEVNNNSRRVVCDVERGSLEQNSKDAKLIVEALNKWKNSESRY